MEKDVLTPKTKFKSLSQKSFSPQPINPLMPICPNLFYGENAEYNFSISPNSKKFRVKKKLEWKEEEDNNIREFVKEFGTKNWKKLSEIYPGKTPKQYREHYFNCLETNIVKKKDFTLEEDETIISFVQKNGRKFAQLSKLIPGRTETSIKNRFYFLSKNNFKHLLRSEVNITQKTTEENNMSAIYNQKLIITDEIKDDIIDDNQNFLITNDIRDDFIEDSQNFLLLNQDKNNFIDDTPGFLNSNQNNEDDQNNMQSTFNFNTEWINQTF